MNFELLSNEEISEVVVSIINKRDNDGSDIKKFFADARNAELNNGIFNPCKNAEDAWPIILEKEIGLNKLKDENTWLASNNNGVYVMNDNPLRAAMIVFLIMDGADE